MAFIGKIAYLALFPGIVFVFVAGMLARVIHGGISAALFGGAAEGPTSSIPGIARLMTGECLPTGGSLHVLLWVCPVVKVLALSWVSCAVFGLLPGDLPLVFAMLLLAAAADLVLCFTSENPRVGQNRRAEALLLLGWAAPLGIVFAALSLRTGQQTIDGIRAWQAANGVLLTESSGGALARSGTAVLLVAALVACVAAMRLRPLGRGIFSAPPGGLAHDLSGPPLAIERVSETAALFVFPLVLVSLFFAGSVSTWYDVVFWFLKIVGVFVLLALCDVVFARSRSERAAAWLLGGAGGLAIAGLALVWAGVSS